jgi:hypothetical protein
MIESKLKSDPTDDTQYTVKDLDKICTFCSVTAQDPSAPQSCYEDEDGNCSSGCMLNTDKKDKTGPKCIPKNTKGKGSQQVADNIRACDQMTYNSGAAQQLCNCWEVQKLALYEYIKEKEINDTCTGNSTMVCEAGKDVSYKNLLYHNKAVENTDLYDKKEIPRTQRCYGWTNDGKVKCKTQDISVCPNYIRADNFMKSIKEYSKYWCKHKNCGCNRNDIADYSNSCSDLKVFNDVKQGCGGLYSHCDVDGTKESELQNPVTSTSNVSFGTGHGDCSGSCAQNLPPDAGYSKGGGNGNTPSKWDAPSSQYCCDGQAGTACVDTGQPAPKNSCTTLEFNVGQYGNGAWCDNTENHWAGDDVPVTGFGLDFYYNKRSTDDGKSDLLSNAFLVSGGKGVDLSTYSDHLSSPRTRVGQSLPAPNGTFWEYQENPGDTARPVFGNIPLNYNCSLTATNNWYTEKIQNPPSFEPLSALDVCGKLPQINEKCCMNIVDIGDNVNTGNAQIIQKSCNPNEPCDVNCVENNDYDKNNGAQCSVDTDCGDGYTCDAKTKTCTAKSCKIDTDCGTGGVCVGPNQKYGMIGVCQKKHCPTCKGGGTCTSNPDCGTGFCVEGDGGKKCKCPLGLVGTHCEKCIRLPTYCTQKNTELDVKTCDCVCKPGYVGDPSPQSGIGCVKDPTQNGFFQRIGEWYRNLTTTQKILYLSCIIVGFGILFLLISLMRRKK